jgi:hypothetical protein
VRRQPQTPIEKAIAQAAGEVRNPRQAKYVAKRNTVGLKRIAVWIPNEHVADFQQSAREAVKRHLSMQGEAE